MREDQGREERQKRLIHYEWRLVKLYLFWVVALSPIILYCWHPEFLSSLGVFLFVKNFFFGYEFGASWFFGALLVGVPIITMLRHIANDKVTLIVAFVVYFYLYSNMMNRGLYDLYENLLRDPKLSFPAGLLWISIGAAISNRRVVCWVEKIKLPIFISGGAISLLLGIAINDQDYIFRIPSVVFLIGIFWKLSVNNPSLCRRLRIYSTHFFCLHYSLIIVMQHFPRAYFDSKIILGVYILLLCFVLSNIIISLSKFKYFTWLKYSM